MSWWTVNEERWVAGAGILSQIKRPVSLSLEAVYWLRDFGRKLVASRGATMWW